MPTIANMQASADAAIQNIMRIDQDINHCLMHLQRLQAAKAAAIIACKVVHTVKDIVEDDKEEEAFDDDFEDVLVQPRDRKVRSDVLTARDAVKAGFKTSKNHKLKPKSERVDRTKTKEARATRRAWLGGYMREREPELKQSKPELKQSKPELKQSEPELKQSEPEQEPDNRSHKRSARCVRA